MLNKLLALIILASGKFVSQIKNRYSNFASRHHAISVYLSKRTPNQGHSIQFVDESRRLTWIAISQGLKSKLYQ